MSALPPYPRIDAPHVVRLRHRIADLAKTHGVDPDAPAEAWPPMLWPGVKHARGCIAEYEADLRLQELDQANACRRAAAIRRQDMADRDRAVHFR
jgi:hypothetical protein